MKVTWFAEDDIYIEELRKTGHYDKIGQAGPIRFILGVI